MAINFFFTIVYQLLLISIVQAKMKCYICSQSGTSEDNLCLNNPQALGEASILDCQRKFCTTFRQDLIDPPVLASFSRGCEDAPTHVNKNVKDETYKTYYRACSKSYCNNGTGKEPIVGNGFGKDIGPVGVIMAPGQNNTRNNSTQNFSSIPVIMVIVALLQYYEYLK